MRKAKFARRLIAPKQTRFVALWANGRVANEYITTGIETLALLCK